MATATFPKQRGITRRGWLAGGVVVIILAMSTALALSFARGGSATALPASTVTVTRGTIVASVNGSGTIAAAQTLDLPFLTSGSVAAVLVEEGDQVAAGQPLARLDTRDLELQVASAHAALESTKIRLAQTQEGNVKQADVAAQQAAVRNAEAQLRSAQAQLDALRNPAPDRASTAEFNLRQAEIDLQAQRDNSSAAKTRAEQDMNRAVESLTQAQSKYSKARADWDWVQEHGTDPLNPSTADAQGRSKRNTLSDGEQRQYYDALVQAEAAMRAAEQALTQAQVSFDNARQAEVANIQKAEAKLADAQQQLVAVKNPTRTDVAQRQASVDQARAGLEQARANLNKLTAPGTETDIAIQQASITQAEQTLKQAQLKLDQATLTAPFDAVVTTVYIVPGSITTNAQPALNLIDRSTLRVDLKLSENDVAKVALGQPVGLTIDALQDWTAQGTVDYIAPAAEESNGVVTYRVRVAFPDSDARVKVGMTANLSITTATRENVLMVPNTALLPKGAGRVVQVPDTNSTTREVEVQTGLTDGTNTEIIGGLNEGTTIIGTPGVQTPRSSGGLFGG
jgi:HlyD family secretion protein